MHNCIDAKGMTEPFRTSMLPVDTSGTPLPEKRIEELAKIENISYESDEPFLDLENFLKNDLGEFRFLTKEFFGPQARKLNIKLKAVSRFSNHFGKIEKKVDQFARLSEKNFEGIVPSSDRPATIDLQKIQTCFHYDPENVINPTNLTSQRPVTIQRRRILIRFDLGNSWFSKGFEEKVGVVCWPPNLFDRNPANETFFKRTANRIPSFATRWGRDPIRLSTDPNKLIPASSFNNLVGTTRVLVPLPSGHEDIPSADTAVGDDALRQLECALALFDVKCNPDTGHFYCDIEINPDSYNPFLQFGLVRYQKNSYRGFEASQPINIMASIMPDRELSARKLKSDIDNDAGIEFTYGGLGYSETNHGLLAKKINGVDGVLHKKHKEAGSLLNLPQIDVLVMQRVKGKNDHSGVPIPSETDGLVLLLEKKDLLPNCSEDGKGTFWKFNLTYGNHEPSNTGSCAGIPKLILPEENSNDDIVILIKEKELLQADKSSSDDLMIVDGPNDLQIEEKINTQIVSRVIASMTVDVSMGTGKGK